MKLASDRKGSSHENSPDWLGRPAAAVENAGGRAPFVLTCDHASNWVPPVLQSLGLPPEELARHIAWDPGALEVARRLARLLDAPLVYATVSRLVLDVNRDPAHAGSIVTKSEDTLIHGNRELSDQERSRRIRDIYEPYHRELSQVVGWQRGRHAMPQLVAIHSFTPIYRGQARPWHVGVLSSEDRRLAHPLIELLRSGGDLTVGDNQPYAPTDGVYHTLSRHSAAGNLRSVMLELRADLVGEPRAQDSWAEKLREMLETIH
jgi:predicted N-formylglutamate amidohydrolase